MAKGDQFNLRPHYKDEGPTLPCDGEVGDLFVFTPLDEGEPDPSLVGLASLWFCSRAMDQIEGRPAIWSRVKFDGIATCELLHLFTPFQDLPTLGEG